VHPLPHSKVPHETPTPTPREREISDGIVADRLLDELSPYLTAMRGNLLRGFEETKFQQTEERDEIWRQYRGLSMLERNLRAVINTGKMASQDT